MSSDRSPNPWKWAFLIVLVLAAAVVASFAIYTFGWRDSATNPPVTGVTPKESAQIDRALEVFRALAQGEPTGDATAREACDDLVGLTQRKPFAEFDQGRVIDLAREVVDETQRHIRFEECRTDLQRAVNAALD
jgi:hypothetical protein